MATDKIHISLEGDLLKQIDEAAARERRTRSEWLREAARALLQQDSTRADGDDGRMRFLMLLGRLSAGGGWQDEHHPELKSAEDFRRWREELWAKTDEQLAARLEE